MFKFRQNVIRRFNLLVIFFFTIIGIIIIGKAAIIMFIERAEWNEKKENNFKHDVPVEARRGNILADDGSLIVSTLPKYKMFFDFVYVDPNNKKEEKEINAKRDTLWRKHLKEVCIGMNKILPGTSVAELEKRFRAGLWPKDGKPKGGYRPYRGLISHLQYKEIQELPIMNLEKKYHGCYTEEILERKNILGNAGNTTFGVVRYPEVNGKIIEEVNGLEKKYNSYLKGENGIGTKAKMRGQYILRVDKQPKDGLDIQTTLNTQMLDICHAALERELKAKTLPAGWAILMETKTGDIKAIVNLSRNEKGEYTDTIGNKTILFGKNKKYIQKNQAMCERYEPGSIFKTVALTAALADGKLTIKDSVPAPDKRSMTYNFNGDRKHDTMHRDNGTGKYSMSDAMMYSSNIGLIHFIRKAYLDDPEQYTKTLQRFGLTHNYKLVDNEVNPDIVMPDDTRWNKYSLHSLAIGYATEMTAINMVSFYNTVANGGKQMKPRLIKAILNNGNVVKSFPTEVINEQLFPKTVANTVTALLDSVVNGKSIIVDKKDWRYGTHDGTGNAARSKMMRIAGKTGTAKQYESNDKLLSFCGFFPADAPEYTLIVQIMYDYEMDPRDKKVKDKNSNGYGGGNTSAVVFKEIAEKIMAERFSSPIENAIDDKRQAMPVIKRGNITEANYLLKGVSLQDTMPNIEKGKEWGEIKYDRKGKSKTSLNKYSFDNVPDVTGMGAKDAIYLLEKCGLNVKIKGYGVVTRQSIPAGKKSKEGATIKLELKP